MNLADQKSSLDTVQAIIARGNDRIAKLDTGLTNEAKLDRTREIREQILGEIGIVRNKMAERRGEARDALPRWGQSAARRRARFADDPATDAQLRLATIETLKRTNTLELIEHLQDAIADKSLAKAEAIRLEFQSRDDRGEVGNARFSSLFGRITDEHALAVEKELQQVDGLAAHAETLITEFSRGQSNPAARLSTARLAGLQISQNEAT